MAPGRRPRAGGSQTNAGPSHAINTHNSPTNSHDPTGSQGLAKAEKDSRPVENVASAVVDMVERACALHHEDTEVVDLRSLAASKPFAFRVATMCSGTEAPVFFIKMLMETFVTTGMNDELFRFRHVFSVEKEPYKQAFISRNTDAIVFRDVLDFVGVDSHARTAKGSVAPIPGDIDILIAGTTCVDFSALNSQKKKKFSNEVLDIAKEMKKSLESADERLCMMWKALDEIEDKLHVLGSSEQTFFSMLLYVRNHRPRIVILENVRGAPFETACDVWFHGLNYAASSVTLDTKECYFPQTRERRYLIAVKRDEFQEADEGVDRFSDIIDKLKRRHSSSVEDFLLADNDTRAQLARLESEDAARNKNTREVPWEHCQLRHDEERRKGLGRSRPVTGWKEDGTNNFYDRMDKITMKAQSARVLDSVDICHLKSQSHLVPRPYDIRYKTKVLDLSQNVDRQKFTGEFGLVPCITPNGMSWITNQWRFVTGLEALILQGLPIERINFSRETQANLLDLAGNAMTTTAVGMVFTAALLCLGGRKLDSGVPLVRSFYGNLEFNDLESPFASTVEVLTPRHGTRAENLEYSTTTWPLNLSDIMAAYVQARRYCCCSGSTKYSVRKTKRCRACSVVRCTNCAGNPVHQFEPARDLEFQPATFQHAERKLTQVLPTVIPSLFRDCQAVDECLLQSPLGVIVDNLWTAEFFYQRTYVTEAVTVQYASNAGFIMRAVIHDEGITWYLILDRHSKLGQQIIKPKTRLEARCMRKKPFARCFVAKTSAFSSPPLCMWEFWIFPQLRGKRAEFQVLKQSTEGRNRVTLQYAEDPNLGDAVNATLQQLAGDYDHHPECESAEDSLHVRKSTDKSPQLYLFKDTTRSGKLDEDVLVISRENRLLQPHEYRETLVEFAPSVQLHKNGLGISPPAEVVLNGCWELMREWRQLSRRQLPLRQPILGNERLFAPTCDPDDLRSCRGDDRLLLELELACPRHADAQDSPMDPQFLLRKLEWVSRGNWAALPAHQMRVFFETFSFATSKAITLIKERLYANIPSCREEGCSVRLPRVEWYTPEPKAIPEALHRTGDIDQYETSLKERAPAFQVQFEVSKTSELQMGVRLRFIGNYARLAHRAEAAMPPERKAILAERSHITLSARIQPRRNAPLVFPLQPFQESIRPLTTLPGGVFAYRVPFVKTGHQLKLEQMLSVNWMMELENYPVPFTERESEEEVVEGLQLRLVGLAERRVTRRGGLVADDIGFGKTVMTLAVIHLQLRGDFAHFNERRRHEKDDGRKALQSSLVIAPSHIVEQWGNEANKFLGYRLDRDVVLVQKLADLRGKHVDKLVRAKLIIVSDAIFALQAYQEPLSFWSGRRYPGLSMTPAQYGKWLADRSYTAWHDDCMACVGDVLGDFLEDDSDNSRTRCMERINVRHRDWENENEELRKHVDQDSSNGAPGAAPPTRPNTRNKKRMFFEEQFVFEFFSFSRVVWDEVGYSNPSVTQFVASVSAVNKWLLSGTPAVQNLGDVCTYAKALGIHLARPIDLREGLPSASRGPSLNNRTRCEIIASYGRLKSDDFVKERHSQGQLFLHSFSFANMVDRDKFPTEHKVVVSSPTLADIAVYQSLQHDISRAEMNADYLAGDALKRAYAALGERMGKSSPGKTLAIESLVHAATVPSFAKQSWLSSSNQLDEEDGTSHGETGKRTFVQAVRKIQARRLFYAKIYIARLFEKLLWLTHRFLVSISIKENGEGKDNNSEQARTKTKGFLRFIKFLKNGTLHEFGGEDNYVLLVRALFPELPYTAKEILCQAASEDGLLLEPLSVRKTVDFPSPPGLGDPIFDFLYATRKTSWCHYYKVHIGKIDTLPAEDLAGLVLDYEHELQLLQQGSSQQGFEETGEDDALAHIQDIQFKRKEANDEELRNIIRLLAKGLRDKRHEIQTARKNAYIADDTHPKLDPTDKKTTKERLALELRKNGVKFASSADKKELVDRLTKHVQGRLSVTDYKSPRYESLQATRRMPSLTATIEIRGAKILETQDEFLTHYNLFIAGLKHLYERSSQLRRARFFDRLSRPEGYKFACDECGSTGSLRLVHDCGHMLCSDHFQNKNSCGEGSTLCTSPLGSFAVPIEELAASARRNDPSKDLQTPSGDVEMSGTDEVTDPDTKMRDVDGEANGVQLDSKIRTVIELIQGKVPHDDKVVVFTQYDQILKVLVEQLRTHGISCNTTTGSPNASEVLESFKKGEFKALVMKQNSSEAAGGNLVVANHVIFVSPLVESSQHEYDAHMRQATGRCIREGQKKKVYVYHCVTEGTIEANILELRQGKEIKVKAGETFGELAESPHVGVPGGLRSTLSRTEVWRAIGEQDYRTTIGMEDGQVEFST